MAKQPIKYWKTTVEAAKTAAELQTILVHAGATSTATEWKEGVPTALTFTIPDARRGPLPIRLEARAEQVVQAVRKKRPGAPGLSIEQAHRIAWRHLRDLTEQQLLAVQLGQQDLAEAFLAAVVVNDSTLGKWLTLALESGETPRGTDGRLLLPAPRGAHGGR